MGDSASGADLSPATLLRQPRPFTFHISPKFGGSSALSKPKGPVCVGATGPISRQPNFAWLVGGNVLLGSVCLGRQDILNGPDTRLGD